MKAEVTAVGWHSPGGVGAVLAHTGAVLELWGLGLCEVLCWNGRAGVTGAAASGEQRAGIQQEQSWGPAESWDPGGLLGFPSVQGQQSTALQGWCEGVKLLLKTISDVPLIHLFCVGAVQMQLLCI